MLFLETVYPLRIAGNLFYCIADIQDLDTSSYVHINTIFECWKNESWLDNRLSNRKGALFSPLIDIEIEEIINKISFRIVDIPINIINSFINPVLLYNYVIKEIEDNISLFKGKHDIYTTTNVYSCKYPITNLDIKTADRDLLLNCFIALLISNKIFSKLLNKYSVLYPKYKWNTHYACLNLMSVKEAFKHKPSHIHKSDFVNNLPNYLNKYFFEDKEIRKYIEYFKKDPDWWFTWNSKKSFREILTEQEIKLLYIYNYYLDRRVEKLIRDKNKYIIIK